jgi:peptide/nickel transport system substrate-binding protein
MAKRIAWLTMGALLVVALTFSSCQPEAEGTEGQTIKGEVTESEVPAVEEKEPKEEKEAPPAKPTGPQYGGALTLATTMEVRYWDLYKRDAMNEPALSYVMERPIVRDWVGTPADKRDFFYTSYTPEEYAVGSVLESWEQPDAFTIIYHVRQGIRFHNKPPVNGRELTAYDVEYTFHRQGGLGSGFTEHSPYIGDPMFQWMESVTATDKWTVVIKTTEPKPMLMMYLAGCATGDWIQAREMVEKYADQEDWDWKGIVGTGPFTLEDFVPGTSYTYERNPSYWMFDPRYPENRLPYVDTVKQLVILDKSTRLAALRTGKICRSGENWEDTDALLRTNPDLETKKYLGGCSCITLRQDLPPFNDIRVRRALQMALDNATIAQTYYGGNASAFAPCISCSYADMSPPLDEYPEEVQEAYTYSPERAKELLAEAGYPDGFSTDLITTAARFPVDLAELAVTYWAQIGVDVELKVMDHGAMRSMAQSRQHTGMAQHHCCWTFFPYSALMYRGGSTVPWNYCNLDDPRFNNLLEDIAAAASPAERTALFKEANMYCTESFWAVKLPPSYSYSVWQPWLKGYNGELGETMHNPGGMDKWLWIDQDLKKAMGH